MTSYCRGVFELSAHKRPIVGDTKMSVIQYDHLGWLRCDGRQLTVADYRFLFEVIGYSFGGSGAYFNLPNPAGRVPGVTGSGTGLTTRALGDTVGEEQHTLTIAEMPAHNHGVAGGGQGPSNNQTATDTHNHAITDPQHSHTYNDAYFAENRGAGENKFGTSASTDNDNSFYWRTANGGVSASPSDINTSSSSTGITLAPNTHSHQLNPAGGSQAHNNMQPTLFMGNMFLYCGKGPLVFQNVPYTANTNVY